MSVCACGDGDEDDAGAEAAARPIAVLSAFPAELAAVLEHVTVTDTQRVDGRVFRIGKLDGVPVVTAMTGIGLLNATAVTKALLDRFNVSGVVVSGVAGSMRQIGDVAVPTAWVFRDAAAYPVDQEWFELVRQIADSGSVTLERCTVPATAPPSDPPVCMLEQPTFLIGGIGHSSDPFGGTPFRCRPTGGDIFGCDIASGGTAAAPASAARALVTAVPDTQEPIVEDEETAAIGREAAARGLPYIAFRAVSDGGGDPLMLPNFLAQFNAYYRLAAHNAAAATAAFLKRLAATPVR